jgi:hypothetical protein
MIDDDARSELSERMSAEYVDAFFRSVFVDGDLDDRRFSPRSRRSPSGSRARTSSGRALTSRL